jgi:hypothetical protein
MGQMHLLDFLPLWAIILLTIGLGLLFVELGYRVGRSWRKKNPQVDISGVGAMIAATLGLWAFLLAFMVSTASNRFDERRLLVVKEANSISTTYLQAGLLPEPMSSRSRELLREYARQRLELVELQTHVKAKVHAVAIHMELWSLAEEAGRMNRDPITAAYINNLNETIDLHTSRVTALEAGKLPFTIYAALYIVGALGLFMLGFQSGINDSRNLVVTLALIIIFSLVMLIIIDLDRSWGGFLRVNQQPIRDLISSLEQLK